ncbi:MAG TPA: 2'-5' RNA ligase family protein [Allosphingosinicella sp.]
MNPVRHRIFYALQPPASARYAMALAITEDHDAPPQAQMDRMARIAGELRLMPFELTLDRLTGSETSLALCPSEKPWQLKLLQRQLRKSLVLCGIRRTGWRFNPHVTLLYRNGAPFSQEIAPISWWVDELVLVHSQVGLTRHDILGRWPLVPDGTSLAA